MSTVIHALWTTGDASPLIMPGSVPAQRAAGVQRVDELPDRRLEADHRHRRRRRGSVPVRIDAERPTFGSRSLTGGSPAPSSSPLLLPWAPRTRGWRSRDYGWGSRSPATRSAISGRRWSCSASVPLTCTTTRPATGTTPPRRSPAPRPTWPTGCGRSPSRSGPRSSGGLRATAGKQTGAFTGVHVAPETSGDVPDSEDARLVVIRQHRPGAATVEVVPVARQRLSCPANRRRPHHRPHRHRHRRRVGQAQQGGPRVRRLPRRQRCAIPNYGERRRAGETISTSFVESAVNQVISKRMVKKQQMRWSPRGAHLLRQIRTRVLNDTLADDYRRWYPAFAHTDRQDQAE